MSFWTAVVVLLAIYALVHLRLEKYRALGRDRAASPPALPSDELERELDELRHRVEVLERIVTDERRSRSLADEIDSLRDP